MRYAGKPITCVVSRVAIEDYYGFSGVQSDDEISRAVSKIFHIIIAAAERRIPNSIKDGRMLITSDSLSGS